jgi:uncharacterized protein YjbI with pentapeptide repeats
MKLPRIFLTTLVVLILLQAEAPIQVVLLRMTKSCPGCRLVGVEINGADLSGANLRNARLALDSLSFG